MELYLDLLRQLADKAQHKEEHRQDRTGVGTVAQFGCRLEHDLAKGFPLLTTKRIHFKSVAYELLWFLGGHTNARWLQERGVSIWDEWADENGELGEIYGAQWRRWRAADGESVDQIAQLIDRLRTDAHSRRHLVSAWNPGALQDMALPPCHLLFQLFVSQGTLSCQVYQRSCDVFLGLPFNLASYALLTHLIADQCDLAVGQLIWVGGDVHLYLNHLEGAAQQLARQPRALPRLELLARPQRLWDYRYEDFAVHDYDPEPSIKAKIAV